jgi:hypothetical protein
VKEITRILEIKKLRERERENVERQKMCEMGRENR